MPDYPRSARFSRRIAAVLLAGGLIAAPLAGQACSPAPGARVPTNLELAGAANSILLAQVVSGQVNADDPFSSQITIHPLAAIEGELPDGDIQIPGMFLAEGDGAQDGQAIVLSNPYEFTQAHPEAYSGSCIRMSFPRGTTVLFFLNQQEGAWRPAAGLFSRWAEDVPGPDAPWVRLAEIYARAADLPEGQQATLLEAARDALLAQDADPVAQLMAADITRQLAGPNKPLREALPPVDGG